MAKTYSKLFNQTGIVRPVILVVIVAVVVVVVVAVVVKTTSVGFISHYDS